MNRRAHSRWSDIGIGRWLLRIVTAAALVVDAVVHLRLASNYALAYPDGIGGGTMFRIEAAVAIIAAIYVLVRGSRTSYAVSFLVAASALGAVLLYRYVEVPSIGPIPSMYEPIWFYEKTLTAIAEGIGVLSSIGGFIAGRGVRADHATAPTRD